MNDQDFCDRNGIERITWVNFCAHSVDDEPAVIWRNGDIAWMKEGDYHRENDKPAEITHSGKQYWYVNGILHRNNGKPAVITSYKVEYYEHGNKIKEEPYDSKIHDIYKYRVGKKTKAALHSTD